MEVRMRGPVEFLFLLVLLPACGEEELPMLPPPASVKTSEPVTGVPVAPARLSWSEPVRDPGRTLLPFRIDAPVDLPASNALWVATNPLAWQALAAVPGLQPDPGDEAWREFRGPPFPESALDPACRLVTAGRVREGILGRIVEEGTRRFGGAFHPPESAFDGPDSRWIVAYAFLLKELPFHHPFEPWEGGLPFEGAADPVPAFGIATDSENLRAAEIRGQVKVVFGEGRGPPGEREFGLEIATGTGDRLLLARIPPGNSLAATWERARERTAGARPRPLPTDAALAVPKIHFELGDHRRLEAGTLPVELRRRVLFRMDEMGLRLVASTSIGIKEAEVPESPEEFLLDRPFLIALRERDATDPYLLLWIQNTDLMPP
jgi:hypothetical protein